MLARGGGGGGGARSETLNPTAVVHEAYLKLGSAGGRYASQEHFKAVAAKAMRQVMLNYAEARRAAKRGGDWERVTLSGLAGTDHPAATTELDLDALDRALAELESMQPRHARVAECILLGGLEPAQVAEIEGVSLRTVQLDWRAARAWITAKLREGAA